MALGHNNTPPSSLLGTLRSWLGLSESAVGSSADAAGSSALSAEAAEVQDALDEKVLLIADLKREMTVRDRELEELKRRYAVLQQDHESLRAQMQDVSALLVGRDQELIEAKERIAELDVVKSEFVSVAAHQLRTPLTAVRWTLRSLATGEFGALSKEQRTAIENGSQAIVNAIVLINDLLDLARIEGGRFGFEFSTQDIGAIVDDAVDRARESARSKGIEITAPPADEPFRVSADRERLLMALAHLIDNAVKYTDPPGAVTLTRKREENDIVITIADSGIGIPNEYKHRLFTKFFRAPNAKLLQTRGTGLGLYLVKNIIDKHGGSIEVTSTEGKGTKVRIRLPGVT